MTTNFCSISKNVLDELGIGDLKAIVINSSNGNIITLEGSDFYMTASTSKKINQGLVLLDLHNTMTQIEKLKRPFQVKGSEFDVDLRREPRRYRTGNDDLPYPYIFKPPSPPGDLGLESAAQLRDPPVKKVRGYNLYCKFCGADLPTGQSICHVCGNKVM
jgi:hypothetical protein